MALSFLSGMFGRAPKREHIVALDLGGHATKAVHLQRRGDKFHLLNYVIIETPQGDKPLAGAALAEHFKNVSRALDAGKTKQVTVAVGANDAVFRPAEVPAMGVSDLRTMLKINSKACLQQEYPDPGFDCCFVAAAPGKGAEGGKEGGKASGGAKQRVLVGGEKRQVLDDLSAALRSAGLVPDQVVPGLAGPVNAFELAEPDAFAKDVVALVDLGFKSSSITVLDAGEIRLNRVVDLGGHALTRGLAEAMGVNYDEAENIKVGMASEIQTNLEPLLAPLGRELRASLDFFENQNDCQVSQVFLSGGPARGEIVVQTLQAELVAPCKAWSPTRFLQLSLPPEKAGEVDGVATQLAVAVGAAATAF